MLNGTCRHPNPHFLGLGLIKGEMDQKCAKFMLLGLCRQPPTETRDVSGHLKSASFGFWDFRIKIDDSLRFKLRIVNFL